jgi:hypothetical protein
MSEQIRGRRAPEWLQRLIIEQFGMNPHGEPQYRLVWAPSRFEQSGGVWMDWEEGLKACERLPEPPEGQPERKRPVRRRAEVRWVRKYPGEECWLIEHWLPASAYGTPTQWGLPAQRGGTMIWTTEGWLPGCGPYPERGDYEDIGARMYWYPTEKHVTTAIGAFARLREGRADRGPRAASRAAAAQREQENRDRAFEALCQDLFDDASQAFGGARMIGYGGTRRHSSVELCDRLGIRQHPF